VQQAESSASRIHHQSSARDNGDAQDQEASIHVGGATGRPRNQGRTPVRERILDMREQAQDCDACNIRNARRKGDAEARAVVGYNPRRGGRYDSREDCSPTPEFSREIHTASFPQCFRQPTTITKYSRETDPWLWLNDYRLACQLGGATTDAVIIRNLPLHLADSTQTWLEHLPPSQSISGTTWSTGSWGTFRARTCAPGTPRTCRHSPKGPTSRSGISYGASPNIVPSSRASLNRSCTLSLRG
jgi:hypothetical protein